MSSRRADLESLIRRASAGDADAYGAVVRRFQDMAVGYARAVLGDAHLAEDAAQEAFLEAFRCLASLREPAAFPGWLRRIVFKHCDRLTRGARPPLVGLEETDAASSPTQVLEVERRETAERVLAAVDALPERQRTAVTLFHLGGYSHEELSAFLEVPVTTVKKRLHDGRARLRTLLVEAVEQGLRAERPSRDERFATGVLELLDAARRGDAVRVREILLRNERLLWARDALGNTALVVAANSGRTQVVSLLHEAGVEADYHESASIGDTRRVEAMLGGGRGVDAYSIEGFTALGLAAHFGHVPTAAFLLDAGADPNAVARHRLGVTPLHSALYGGRVAAARLLLDRGADPNIRRGGAGWPRAGWTALHYAAGYGFVELVEPMLERGADPGAVDDEGRTPLEVAAAEGHERIARLLDGHQRR